MSGGTGTHGAEVREHLGACPWLGCALSLHSHLYWAACWVPSCWVGSLDLQAQEGQLDRACLHTEDEVEWSHLPPGGPAGRMDGSKIQLGSHGSRGGGTFR